MSVKEISKSSLNINQVSYKFYDLKKAAKFFDINLSKMPNTIKMLFENLIRYQDGIAVTENDIKEIAHWDKTKTSDHEISFRPARVLMQDFTGVPAVVDLAVMRDAIVKVGGDVSKINPLSRVDLVIDHSVQVGSYGHKDSFFKNVHAEFQDNQERYEFLKWGQEAFDNFSVVPPGTGICHQVNLEYLAKIVWSSDDNGVPVLYPDTLVGTDSHTTMVNGLSVLGWGVGGIEAEAAMLGQPISMLIPEVIGVKLHGSLKEGVTATDLVLTITEMLRKKGVVGKFVEFFGEGLRCLSLESRATIANMAPEYGATCGFFPIDQETVNYMTLTGRDQSLIDMVQIYSKEQGLWYDYSEAIEFTDVVSLDLSLIEPCISGPRRPQDVIKLRDVKANLKKQLGDKYDDSARKDSDLQNGDIAIAAITSCTNTSNPDVMVAAGLVAKKAYEMGLLVKPWVKTSLAPGSKVVSDYLEKTDLQQYLDKQGFNLVGYGCTTCIGNSGSLNNEIAVQIEQKSMTVAAVLSGNRNFEGRINPLVKFSYLASPPLVIIYAIAGTINIDLYNEPLGIDKNGNKVFMKDLWPSNAEIKKYVSQYITPEMFRSKYHDLFEGEKMWQDISVTKGQTYSWNNKSTYIKKPPYFDAFDIKSGKIKDIHSASLLALFGDSITTDHISPAGNISPNTPAGQYLLKNGVTKENFNSYGARRGNHEVMIRGTFANVRIRNELLPETEGGVTKHYPSDEKMSIYDASVRYAYNKVPLIVIAGKEYGTGSSRDWAAKGTRLLGVEVVIAESFERIHRSNLIGMGVIPLVFKDGMTRKDLDLVGDEKFDLIGIDGLSPNKDIVLRIHKQNSNKTSSVVLEANVFTENEVAYIQNGGILPYVLRQML
ncbi:MAG: aconitate hydratase AcnA [Rickettsiales bacterium]|nr:aconitate hydratase AcnA [Rickettsiales bacterium]